MKEFYLFLILATAFFFYFSLGGGEEGVVETSGMRTLLFLFMYFILTVYRHHYELIVGCLNTRVNFFNKIIVSTLSISMPIIVVGSTPSDKGGGLTVILAIFLCLMTLDFNSRLRINILYFLEKRAKGGGDMFITYPPKNLFDIITPIVFYCFIAFILYMIL